MALSLLACEAIPQPTDGKQTGSQQALVPHGSPFFGSLRPITLATSRPLGPAPWQTESHFGNAQELSFTLSGDEGHAQHFHARVRDVSAQGTRDHCRNSRLRFERVEATKRSDTLLEGISSFYLVLPCRPRRAALDHHDWDSPLKLAIGLWSYYAGLPALAHRPARVRISDQPNNLANTDVAYIVEDARTADALGFRARNAFESVEEPRQLGERRSVNLAPWRLQLCFMHITGDAIADARIQELIPPEEDRKLLLNNIFLAQRASGPGVLVAFDYLRPRLSDAQIAHWEQDHEGALTACLRAALTQQKSTSITLRLGLYGEEDIIARPDPADLSRAIRRLLANYDDVQTMRDDLAELHEESAWFQAFDTRATRFYEALCGPDILAHYETEVRNEMSRLCSEHRINDTKWL